MSLGWSTLTISQAGYRITTPPKKKNPDGDDITWEPGGNDRHAFSIDASGVLTFRSSPNSNNPMDSDQDNVYNLVVVATDDGTPSKSAKREVRIAVYKLYGHPVYPCGPLGMYGLSYLWTHSVHSPTIRKGLVNG